MTLHSNLRLRIEHVLTAYSHRRDAELAAHGIKHRFRFRGDSVTIIRTEPGFPGFPGPVDIPFAQLRYVESARRWTLYCADRNGKWHCFKTSMRIRPAFSGVETEGSGIRFECEIRSIRRIQEKVLSF